MTALTSTSEQPGASGPQPARRSHSGPGRPGIRIHASRARTTHLELNSEKVLTTPDNGRTARVNVGLDAARDEVTGQAGAVERICAWLDRWQHGTGPGAWWPETISRAEHAVGAVRQGGPGRPSWCYGTPGLARAQQLVGLALGGNTRARLAEQALAGCLADERQLAQLTDASLCHGWAGALQAAWRITGDAADPGALTEAVTQLRARTEDFLARSGPPATPGLLEGTAGVSLAQHTTSSATAPPTSWDACMLLDI